MVTPAAVRGWLESGDRLTLDEFLARYEDTPEDFHAELIDGVVYVASPIRLDSHGPAGGLVLTWLGVYVAQAEDVALSSPVTTIFRATGDSVEPDAMLFRQPGGMAATRTGSHYMERAPEFVVEVAASSASRDSHQKKRAYERNGVQEYVVWRVLDEAIDWYRLEDGKYIRVEPEGGIIESREFPGLRLDVPAMLALDAARVLAAVRPPER